MELQRKSTHTSEARNGKHKWEKQFLSPWLEYAVSQRDVFLDEILNFVRGAGSTQSELERIRTALQLRRQAILSKRGGRGKPPGSRRVTPVVRSRLEEFSFDSAGQIQHLSFRSICMVCGDFPDQRPLFLGQILLFIGGADKPELAAIRSAVAKRARSRGFGGIVKARGRPDLPNDEELMYRSRVAAWRCIIDEWSEEKIATALEMPLRSHQRNSQGMIEIEGNIESVRRQLQRLQDYLAARIYETIPSYWLLSNDRGHCELRPDALEHKPLQQLIHLHTGLPFKTLNCTEDDLIRNEQCKRVVRTLLKDDRGRRASAELIDRQINYKFKKNRR